jgi:hypothetical protein
VALGEDFYTEMQVAGPPVVRPNWTLKVFPPVREEHKGRKNVLSLFDLPPKDEGPI